MATDSEDDELNQQLIANTKEKPPLIVYALIFFNVVCPRMIGTYKQRSCTKYTIVKIIYFHNL